MTQKQRPLLQNRAAESASHPRRIVRVAYQLMITHQAEQLFSAFNAHGIDAVLLKGVAFWTCIYDVGQRLVSDLDILIPSSQRISAERLMSKLGYSRVVLVNRPVTDREFYEVVYFPPHNRGVGVELHTSLAHPARFRWKEDELLKRAVACRIGRCSALRLSNEDALLHLAIHRTIHGFGFDADTRNIADADRIVRFLPVDWGALVERARRWGCVNALWILLDSARESLGTPVPLEVFRQLCPGRLRGLYMRMVLARDRGNWIFRWPGMAGWRRRLLLFPLVLDRPDQYLRSLSYYLRLRVRDAIASSLRPLPREGLRSLYLVISSSYPGQCGLLERKAALLQQEGQSVDLVRLEVKRAVPGRHWVHRLPSFFLNYAGLIRAALKPSRYNAILVTTTPPLGIGPLVVRSAITGERLVIYHLDIFPENAEVAGLIHSRLLLAFLRVISHGLLRRGDEHVTLSTRMADTVQCLLGESGNVSVEPALLTRDDLRPVPHEENPWRGRHGLSGKFVVMYAGNFGAMYDFSPVVDAAEKLRHHEDVVFVFVGTGQKGWFLREAARRIGSGTVMVLPPQPEGQIAQVLSAGDVHVVPLVSGADRLMWPSKVDAIQQVGRPILAVGWRLERDGVISVEPGELADAILSVRDSSSKVVAAPCIPKSPNTPNQINHRWTLSTLNKKTS